MARKRKWTARQLEEKFDDTAFRISQERNDFLLPQIIDFVRNNKWLNLRPEYQRRLVWDLGKRSRFIESLLLNIPIPPVFLFEWELGRYEVMDGQQRLNSVVEFYENGFALKGLEKWKELTGYRYLELPDTLRRGLDRRRISATVLLADRPSDKRSKHNEIRKLVFDRLNSGGLQLNAQELRNCLYDSQFNKLLIELAQDPTFQQAWDIPLYRDHVDSAGNVGEPLASDHLYKRMLDCEIVLRYFAMRQRSRIKGSVRSMLDKCMEDHVETPQPEVDALGNQFRERLGFAVRLFGKETFRYQDEDGKLRLSQPLYDAVMVAIDRQWKGRTSIYANRSDVKKALAGLLRKKDAYDVIVGRPNTAKAIEARIALVEKLFIQSA